MNSKYLKDKVKRAVPWVTECGYWWKMRHRATQMIDLKL